MPLLPSKAGGTPLLPARNILVNQWCTARECLQNLHNRGVAAKLFQTNELAPEAVPACLFLFVFDLYIQYSGLRVTNMPCGSYCVVRSYFTLGLDKRFLGQKPRKNFAAIRQSRVFEQRQEPRTNRKRGSSMNELPLNCTFPLEVEAPAELNGACGIGVVAEGKAGDVSEYSAGGSYG